jgi:hypothetical protein
MNPILVDLTEKHANDIDANKFEDLVHDSLSMGVFDELRNVFKDVKISLNLASITKPSRTFAIDAAYMPSCLIEEHFDVWAQKFNQLIKKIGLKEWDFSESTIHIKFSNKEETKKYGNMSLDEAKDIIRKKWKLDERAEELLSQIHDIDTLNGEQWSSHLAEVILVSNREYSYDEIRKILDELFGRVYFTKRILGEYRHSERTILLYAKNIELTRAAGRTLEQSFELTFIHELFHAYHYRRNDRELRHRRDYTSDVVKESLAATFEWSYCVEYKIAGDSDLRRDWETHSVLAYPYSGAKHLINCSTCKLECTRFRIIFNESLDDIDQALRLLLPTHDFYSVKNIEKEVMVTDSRKAFDALMGDDVGIIAQREIPIIVKKNKSLREKLLDMGYCKTTFKISYPVLSLTREFLSGQYRYYEDSIIYYGKEYFLCSEWDKKRHLNPLLDWLWANR